MKPARRDIIKYAGALTAAATGICGARRALASEQAAGGHGPALSPDVKGVLVDLTDCIGCRLCEFACKKANDIEPGPLASYDDTSVFREQRRPAPQALTVINSFQPHSQAAKPVYTKVNCLHCNHASCVSACIVGALEKQASGAVTYDSWKCIGCRYCMVACPFGIPTYEYDNAFTPQVKKCEFCDKRTAKGELPGCVKECPRQALTYGRREDLIAMAHRKIAEHPERYVDHVYGEHEVGGTSWLYVSGVPFEQAGFVPVGNEAPPALTEAIQHGVFKHWIAPTGWYGFLASMYWFTGRRSQVTAHKEVAVHHPHPAAAPVKRKLLTPGVWALIAMVLTGAAFGLYRFIFGLAAATNLDQEHPWGLWIAMDVGSGIALAGGGFVTAAVVHIFHREHYHGVARSALLTALLGYTFYVPGLLADLGRWYNLWHPTIPTMWQGNSVLFEVGLCVMIYLNVQYAELMPIVCERLMGEGWIRPQIKKWIQFTHDWAERVMPALLILGVALSTFHQSSLGNLMVIAPYKLHHLWWSPVAPVLFLLSAMMVGFPMVIFTMLFGGWCLKRRPDMKMLTPLTRYVIIFALLYLAVKVGDMWVRGTYMYLTNGSLTAQLWVIEMFSGLVLPLGMLMFPGVRRSPKWLGISCLLIILGVVLNRLNVFIMGYAPPFATKTYFPSLTEVMLSMGLVAALMLAWRVAVTYLPILEPEPAAEGQGH